MGWERQIATPERFLLFLPLVLFDEDAMGVILQVSKCQMKELKDPVCSGAGFPADLLACIKIGNQFHFGSDDLYGPHGADLLICICS